ncbi:hypothetical protein IU402_03590 [Aerococcaceae bacterium zg-BR9]|uniref:hypothetical protein n=1 Tax=Aerococcaceae bacterium zg-1292 TaxID=2774330 RepID=UPI00406404FF|nr:hypothetical protein [Aerococcaceae bacterium zg-BR9]MBF6977853.1 hypothetical protein [Aerococcaceae bacterium zg-BR22]
MTQQGEPAYISGLKHINSEMKLLQTQSKTAMAALSPNIQSDDKSRTLLSKIAIQHEKYLPHYNTIYLKH